MVQLKVDAYLDTRLVAAIDVMKQHWQAPAREKEMLAFHILLKRIGEVRPSAPRLACSSQSLGQYRNDADACKLF